MTRLPPPTAICLPAAVLFVATSAAFAGPALAGPDGPVALNVTAHSGSHKLGRNPHLSLDQTVTVRADGFAADEVVQVRSLGQPGRSTLLTAGADGAVTYDLRPVLDPPGPDVLTFVGVNDSSPSAAAGTGNVVARVPEHAVFPFTVGR